MLGVLAFQRGEYTVAAQHARASLRLLQAMPVDTAPAEVQQRERIRNANFLVLAESAKGIANARSFAAAADLFRMVTAADPENRDFWSSFAFARLQEENWPELVPLAQRVLQLDPLGQNGFAMAMTAYAALQQPQQRTGTLQTFERLPVLLADLDVTYEAGSSALRGAAVGHAAGAGTPVRVEVTFSALGRDLATTTASIVAPPRGTRTPFQAAAATAVPATGFRYRVLP